MEKFRETVESIRELPDEDRILADIRSKALAKLQEVNASAMQIESYTKLSKNLTDE